VHPTSQPSNARHSVSLAQAPTPSRVRQLKGSGVPPRSREKPQAFVRAGGDAVFHRGWFWLAMGPSPLREQLVCAIQHYGVVRVGPLAEAQATMASEPERWGGLISDGAANDPRLSRVRGMFPQLACLSLDGAMRKDGRTVRSVSDTSVLEQLDVMDFVQRAFVRAYVPDERVAQVVVEVARRVGLTVREMQLLCFCLGDEPRSLVQRRLGISENTLKTQTRGLLRKAGQRNVNAFAKNVLREALLLEREPRQENSIAPMQRAG
jgi:DNA-binding CsgD family transcriptional regulator